MTHQKYILNLADGLQLHYYQWGKGPEQLLAFHGFGQDGLLFQPMIPALTKQYTIYSFDIFFHGSSLWPFQEQPLTKDQWRKILTSFFTEKGIDRFSMAGYSLGGRFALVTTELFAGKVDRLILMAPDGIKTSFWYNFATYPLLIRKLFKRTITRPGMFFGLNNLLGYLGLLDKGLLKFTTKQMNTSEKRHRVYYSWIVFRKMIYNPAGIARIINQSNIITQVFLGKYDKVITPESVSGWVQLLENSQSNVFEVGHNDLVTATAKSLKPAQEK